MNVSFTLSVGRSEDEHMSAFTKARSTSYLNLADTLSQTPHRHAMWNKSSSSACVSLPPCEMSGVSQECNKEMHQNKRVESVRTQIKGHRFHSKQSRFVVGRTPLDDLSLGVFAARVSSIAVAGLAGVWCGKYSLGDFVGDVCTRSWWFVKEIENWMTLMEEECYWRLPRCEVLVALKYVLP